VALIRTDVSDDRIYESLPIQDLTTSLCNLLALVHPEDGGDTILRNVGSYKSHTIHENQLQVLHFDLIVFIIISQTQRGR
jgi:hypothetical protein